MDTSYDLVIRGGRVIDGSGAAARVADVGVREGWIVAVGPALARGKVELSAAGLVVTPGFVDVHTHYDGQATWDSRLAPSSQNGVTTVVIGNCGVGFAPCRPADHGALIELMEGVEDIPGSALAEGLAWDWESFPDYLDALARRPHDMDVAALIPHGPLRVYVMGERALRREAATPDDIAAMQALIRAALAAGAMGLATSRTMAHRSSRGDYTPMYEAAAAEIIGLGEALADSPGAVFQMISDFDDPQTEFELIREVCRRTGCAGTLTVVQYDHKPRFHEQLLAMISAANAEGLRITGQVLPRPPGVLMGFDTSLNPFSCRPSYAALAALPLAERVAQLRRPEVRAAILGEADHAPHVFMQYYGRAFQRMFPLEAKPDYLPGAEASVAARAAAADRDPAEWLYDYCLGDAGSALVYLPMANYSDGNPDVIEAMLKHPHTVPALGDGGAHVATICDAGYATFLLTEWVLRRQALPLEAAVQMLSQRPAELYGMHDRGQIAPGLRADLNLIDLDALGLERPHLVRDLPAGGRRFLQVVHGIRATVVGGEITYLNGQSTGALPGQLVRRTELPQELPQ